MKYDFSKPLTEEQLKIVRYCQDHDDDVVVTGKEFGIHPDEVFRYTIQDYEGRRQPLMEQSKTEMTKDLMIEINSLYAHEVALRKCWEDLSLIHI